MDTSSIRNVVVIGTGIMGPGIALGYAAGGRQVTIVARTEESAARGRDSVEGFLQALEEEGLFSPRDSALTLDKLDTSTDLESAVRDADLVVESIVERLETKRALFTRLDSICRPETILTSNTSGLRITEIAAGMSRPERAATTHYWNPSHLMPLVEIVKGERTSQGTVDLLHALLTEIGKRPAMVRKDVPGQLGNRIFHAIRREAMYIVQEGIATAEEVDMAVKMGFGLRFPVHGPLEHADLNGLEMSLAIHSYIVGDLCRDPEPMAILREKVARGETGAKAGKGFYDWSQRSPVEVRRVRDRFLMARVKEMYPPKRPSQS